MMRARLRQVALVLVATAGVTNAFRSTPLISPTTSARCGEKGLTPNVLSPRLCRHQHQRQEQQQRWQDRRLLTVNLFGLGGGRSGGASAARGDVKASKAQRLLENNATLKARTDQYTKGAITAVDLVRYLEKDVAGNVLGCDLDDVVAAALTRIPDTRKKDLLAKASRGKAIGPGGAVVSSGLSLGGSNVIVDGQLGKYAMSQGGQRVSSGKSTIYNGVEIGKEAVPLKLKVTARSNVDLAAAEVSNLERIKDKNGVGASSRHFVGFKEFIENYNGRGDKVMVMQAGTVDLRKVAESSGEGGLAPPKIRKYASEMASIMRCIHKAGLVWTDLKLDNMVLYRLGGDEVRAIDLEGAVLAGSAPKSYTPEATPPDFVLASQRGFAGVTVDRSFDVWSLGMAILHLYLGRGYFQGSKPPQTITTLGQEGFAVDLSGISDTRIQGLLKGLLDPDPQKRLRYFDSPLGQLAFLL